MARFRGTYDHTLDQKNRLTMPARFREDFANRVVLARPLDLKPCVCVWQVDRYERHTEEALQQLSSLSGRRLELERFFDANSHDVKVDAAGRVMIPPALRERAGLEHDVVVLGVGERLEVWDPNRWKEHQTELTGAVAEVTARVDDAA